jgi:hypothetical protein
LTLLNRIGGVDIPPDFWRVGKEWNHRAQLCRHDLAICGWFYPLFGKVIQLSLKLLSGGCWQTKRKSARHPFALFPAHKVQAVTHQMHNT